MKFSSRFFLYAPIGFVLMLAILVTLHWRRTAGAFEAELAALKGHQAVPGVTLDWSNVTVGGYPFRLDAVFDGFSVRGNGVYGPFSWQSDHFALHALTYGAQKDVFEAAGNQRLSWRDAAGEDHSISFLPGSLRASAVRRASALTRFDVDIIELDGKGISIGRAQFHMRRDPDGKSIDLAGDADLAKGDLGAFGTELKTLRFYQTLSQAAAFAPLLRGDQGPRAADAAWRKAGGAAKATHGTHNGRGLTPQQAEAANQLLAPLY